MRTMRFALLAFVLALAAAPASAQVPAAQATKVADAAIGRLRSPFCPGLMLEVCPSGPAEALRDTIRMMAARGMPAGAIVEDVLARHGEQWRAVPRRSGAGLWAWVLPPAVLLLGLAFIWRRMRKMRGEGREAAVAGAAPLSAAERAELDAALRDFDRAGAA
ncbi:MAG TPA: cytochrome c-type biogenesis protein CcmH [Longimicrobium sp.]|nr:cytochrome c-type biogenesis protein CcmH [Longimicrobium sp.]